MPRQRLQLIPERLGLDLQPLARHHPDLAFQRQMVGVLRDRHADGEGRRAAPARDLRRLRRRGDHGTVARAAALLPRVALDAIRRLHRGDAVGRLALPGEIGGRPATGRAGPLVRRELMPHLDHGHGRLLARAMARPRRPRGARQRGRRRPVENGRPRLLERLLDGERELRDLREPAPARELRRQLDVLRNEPLILTLEQPADLSERLDVAFLSEWHHDAAQ